MFGWFYNQSIKWHECAHEFYSKLPIKWNTQLSHYWHLIKIHKTLNFIHRKFTYTMFYIYICMLVRDDLTMGIFQWAYIYMYSLIHWIARLRYIEVWNIQYYEYEVVFYLQGLKRFSESRFLNFDFMRHTFISTWKIVTSICLSDIQSFNEIF